jgi:hypothetical protein
VITRRLYILAVGFIVGSCRNKKVQLENSEQAYLVRGEGPT